jgi:hypothetical protein
MRTFQKTYLNFPKYPWHELKSCRELAKIILYSLLSVLCLTSCDKVVNDVAPPSQPVIPQATTEIFKQMYPEVASFIFKPLETGKTWQSDFVSPKGKVLSLVDYYGDIIDFNELVGTTKTLPAPIKQYILSNYPTAQIITAYDVMKSSTQTDGYKLTIQTDKNIKINVFFDANNAFLRQENASSEKVFAINFTSTDQVNFDPKIPDVVKQFISNNQIKNASLTIYELVNNGISFINVAYKIILNFRERSNGALLTSEVTLSDTGEVVQWISLIENDYTYKVLTNNNLTADISEYVSLNYNAWQYDYGVTEMDFGQIKTNYATFKNSLKERVLLIDNLPEKQDLIIIRSQILAEKDLPQIIKNTISNAYPGAIFVSGIVTFDPLYQATKLGGNTPLYYQIETKEGPYSYALRIANEGKLIIKYKIQ